MFLRLQTNILQQGYIALSLETAAYCSYYQQRACYGLYCMHLTGDLLLMVLQLLRGPHTSVHQTTEDTTHTTPPNFSRCFHRLPQYQLHTIVSTFKHQREGKIKQCIFSQNNLVRMQYTYLTCVSSTSRPLCSTLKEKRTSGKGSEGEVTKETNTHIPVCVGFYAFLWFQHETEEV